MRSLNTGRLTFEKEDSPETVLVCNVGWYQYNLTPIGLTTALATFQQALEMILTQLRWNICLVHIDDVIIYSNTVEDHIRHVAEILTALQVGEVRSKTNKCYFVQHTIE